MASKKTAAAQLLEFARTEAKRAKVWSDLHNAIYGIGGKFLTLFPKSSDRAAFAKSSEFEEIAKLIADLRGEEAPAGTASGKFVVRLPASLHAALQEEAEAEGVSLNQLVVSKIAAQLKAVV